MKLSEVIEKASLEIVFTKEDCEILHAYTGDLLSLVMKNAKSDSIWITVQSHVNIIAVASMVGVKAIVLCEGLQFSDETVEKAKEEGITLLRSPDNAFLTSGKIFELGIR
ncbi:MAG: iron-sulfur binding hydrogenase [Thermosipho sp. (in: Bacteria)]|nr:iron-sulfur binding hydrogenase [Thermosipho sp. (in: thermotogales)]